MNRLQTWACDHLPDRNWLTWVFFPLESFAGLTYVGYSNATFIFRHPLWWLKRWWRIRSFPAGTVVEDCSFHPCIIVNNNGGDLDVWRITSHSMYGCDLFHCGIRKLTPDEVIKKTEAWKADGDRGLAILEGWTEEAFTEFERVWR